MSKYNFQYPAANCYLRRIQNIYSNIENKNAAIEALKDLDTIAQAALDPENYESRHIKFALGQERLESEIDSQLELWDEAEKTLDRIFQKHPKFNILGIILKHRYLYFESWETIAEKLHYSVRHVTRLHIEALQVLEKNLK